MLSRVADSLYWMARYLERAEHTARIVGVQLNLIVDQTDLSPEERWNRILEGLGNPEVPAETPRDHASLTRALLYDPAFHASIVSSMNNARENCRQVRNQISSEMWEQLNRLYHLVRRHAADRRQSIPLEFLLAVDEGVHLFKGITDSTMSHNEAWQFIQIGCYLERATNTATLLDAHFRHPSQHLDWIALLRSCTAFEAYCRARTADVRPDWAAEFLLLDDLFPHSVRFSVDQVRASLATLTGPGGLSDRTERLVGRLQASLRYIQIEEVMASGVHRKLEEIQQQCDQIHLAIQDTYIDYSIEEALGA